VDTLDRLGRHYGTDKSSDRLDYLNFYERFLAPLQDRPITLLEIGVGEGRSLRMWRDYFLQGRIIGMDIVPDKIQYKGDRITIEIGDQADADAIRSVAEAHGPFDVVVDDAGHVPSAQISTFITLSTYMKPGGFYILEDIMEQTTADYLLRLASIIISQGHHNVYGSISFRHLTSVIGFR